MWGRVQCGGGGGVGRWVLCGWWMLCGGGGGCCVGVVTVWVGGYWWVGGYCVGGGCCVGVEVGVVWGWVQCGPVGVVCGSGIMCGRGWVQ